MIALDRRSLLVAGGAGIGLIVGFALWPREAESPLDAAKGERLFGPYIKVGREGVVTVAIPQAETGQGIWTALAQVAADELGADWTRVAVEPAPSAPDYANVFFDTRLTAGSTSMRAFEAPIREAASAARGLLVRAAADRFGVAPEQCTVGGGQVRHGRKALAFADVAEHAARLSHAAPVGKLTDRLTGRPMARIDLPAKSDGTLRFAGDVRVPDLLFAAARLAPPGAALTGFDRAAGLGEAGAKELVAESGWLAAIASNGWAAEQALKAAAPRFSGSRNGDTAAIDRALDAAMKEGSAVSLIERGDFISAVGQARALGATYRVSPALHEGLEPLTATARFTGGKLEVWAPVQAHDFARAAAARAAAIDPSRVVLYPMPVGDSGGRAVEADTIPIAVSLAKRTGRPVQLTLSAASSRNVGRPRPPLLARMAAMPSPSGGITAWSARFVTAPGLESAFARMQDKSAVAVLRNAEPPYAIPTLKIDCVSAALPIACGYLRGGHEALTNFANECFVDELARNLGHEPFAFRMSMLAGNTRLARTLAAATATAGWDGGGQGSKMGLACASAFGSHISLVAVAGVGADQRIEVQKLVATVDCGRVINPRLVQQQIEGGLIHALSLATVKAPTFVAGLPIARGFRSSGIGDALGVPEVMVELIPSADRPGGVSGLSHTVLAPALANALAAATGRRLRSLPFDLMAA